MEHKERCCHLRVNEYTPLAWPVPRMVRVGRRAVLADRCARGIVGVEPVMAFRAQAAELAEPECVVVPSMRRDVVGDGRWRDAASFQAQPAQGLDHELMRSAACPARGAIPSVDLRRVRHRGQSSRFLHFPNRESAVCRNQTRLVCRTPRPKANGLRGAIPAMDVRRVRHRGEHARQTRVRADASRNF